MSYAKIVADGKASRVWTADELKAIKLKTPGQYTLVGQSVPQLDIPPKTNGTAKYGIDAMVPGMLYGKPVVPPVRYGATVKAVDETAAKKVKGFVKAVTLDDKTATTSGWVVAVATTYPAAKQAAEALKITYDNGPYAKVSDQTLIDEAKRLQAGRRCRASSSSRRAIRRRRSPARPRRWRRSISPPSTSTRRSSR